jgi:hypothetical protein
MFEEYVRRSSISCASTRLGPHRSCSRSPLRSRSPSFAAGSGLGRPRPDRRARPGGRIAVSGRSGSPVVGAALGDWLVVLDRAASWKPTVQHIWPLSSIRTDPEGEAFIKKWGALGIFIGRFSGPLRASVPLVAGIFEMPFWRFPVRELRLGVRRGPRRCCCSATACRR